ncbi:MAG: class I SAM-dependent methyltransferase [Acidobacteriia bacterium]|nr:class I SAM-dependent methyltransferase [Terriglobia bacterium]
MNTEQPVRRQHSHMAWVGIVGIVGGAVLMVYVPSLKAVSKGMLLFAGFHFVGLLVLLASAYVVGGNKIVAHFRTSSHSQDSAGFSFGWAPAWTHGPWIAALILGATAVALQVAAPAYWPVAMASTLLAASFFAGGLVTRSVGQYERAFLPMVDLLSGDEKVVLDAGCGAGRTTIALGRAQRTAQIVALDRFDSDYIEGGGKLLLEQNLRKAGLAERVRIERGDLTALPFADQSFDAVVSAHAVDHLGKSTERGLREILRVLKPGGRFLLVVWVPGWTMFSVANILALSLSSKRTWRQRAASAGFRITDEGTFNGNWFAVLKKPEA